MKCAGCRRALSGQYLKALNKGWHPACFRCAGCKKPIGYDAFSINQGHPYHSRCYMHLFGKKCAGCGNWIDGEFTAALQRAWHPHCFTCAGCAHPILDKSFSIKENQAWHKACYHQKFSEPCSICQAPLVKKVLVDAWGNKYCPGHERKLKPCFSCSRLICDSLTKGGQRYPDGTHICNLCFETAVMNPKEAEQIFRTVVGNFEQMGFPFKGATLPFRLVDSNQIKAGMKKRKKPVLGKARNQITMQGNKVVKREFKEVVLIHGMPREMFEVVAIHELCHAWLFYNHFYGLPEKVEEGICVLAEYLWLQKLTTPEANYRKNNILKDPDPVYGQGFRNALKATQKHSLGKMLQYVQKNKKFPGSMLGWLLG